MKKHEYNFFPECSEQDFNAIVESMKTIGYDSKFPIYTYEEKILDGWNRYQSAKKAKVEPIFKEFKGTNQEALEFSFRSNMQRRQLEASQKTALTIVYTGLVKTLFEETEKEQRRKQSENAVNRHTKENLASEKKFSEARTDSASTRTASKIAELAGTNQNYVNQALKLQKENPEKFEQVLKGEKNFSEIKKEEKQQKQQIQYAEKLKVAEEKRNNSTIETPKKFDIVLADPPWRYDFAETDSRKIENHYDTATLDEIKKHKPKTEDNACLFLWATAPKLLEAIEVMKAWGFEYKTHAVWDKVTIGMGYWFRGQHEILIVATKGKFSPPNDFNRGSSIFVEKKNKHSEKPICVYEWIEKCYPSENKLEMYCRSSRQGWHVWGNEV